MLSLYALGLSPQEQDELPHPHPLEPSGFLQHLALQQQAMRSYINAKIKPKTKPFNKHHPAITHASEYEAGGTIWLMLTIGNPIITHAVQTITPSAQVSPKANPNETGHKGIDFLHFPHPINTS